MKREIEAAVAKLELMIERASDKADSENEKTAERYEEVVQALEAARDAMDEALAAFD
jgi:exonuclease VII small subunit